jgi:FkbM family methyltransferase
MSTEYLSQETEIKIIDLLIPYLDNSFFVDIGAEKGSFALFLLKHGMNGVLFEPMPKHFPVLEAIVNDYPDVSLLKCAITNVDSKQSFHVATDLQGNELDYFHSLQKAEAPGVFAHNKSFEVECRSIESLVKQGQISSELGILKTDTEGNDLNVLKGL